MAICHKLVAQRLGKGQDQIAFLDPRVGNRTGVDPAMSGIDDDKRPGILALLVLGHRLGMKTRPGALFRLAIGLDANDILERFFNEFGFADSLKLDHHPRRIAVHRRQRVGLGDFCRPRKIKHNARAIHTEGPEAEVAHHGAFNLSNTLFHLEGQAGQIHNKSIGLIKRKDTEGNRLAHIQHKPGRLFIPGCMCGVHSHLLGQRDRILRQRSHWCP